MGVRSSQVRGNVCVVPLHSRRSHAPRNFFQLHKTTCFPGQARPLVGLTECEGHERWLSSYRPRAALILQRALYLDARQYAPGERVGLLHPRWNGGNPGSGSHQKPRKLASDSTGPAAKMETAQLWFTSSVYGFTLRYTSDNWTVRRLGGTWVEAGKILISARAHSVTRSCLARLQSTPGANFAQVSLQIPPRSSSATDAL